MDERCCQPAGGVVAQAVRQRKCRACLHEWRPYLSQGTACPLKINVLDIHGASRLEGVVRDVVWSADMCFSKPDMGMSLPWALHVADAGALQLARSYRITGITA